MSHTRAGAFVRLVPGCGRWKESDFITDFTDAFSTVATREATPREAIRKRLLLVLYALGTNIGIKRVADGGTHGESKAVLRATRYLFVNRDNLRAAIATLVNSTPKLRDRVLRHCTDATIDRQYTDTHGQNLIGFAFSHLLGFKLLPRTKNVAHQKLARAGAGDPVPDHLAGMVSGQGDQLGADRPAVRPDGQVRHRPAAGHRRG